MIPFTCLSLVQYPKALLPSRFKGSSGASMSVFPVTAAAGGRGEQGKFWELVLPSLQNVAWQMVETEHFLQLFGKTRMNNLVQENLLVEGAKGRQAGVNTKSYNLSKQFEHAPGHIAVCV